MQRRRLFFGVALAVASAIVFAREPAARPQAVPAASGASQGPGELAGRVVDAQTHTPLPEAIVTLGGRGAPARVLADPQGRFVFRDLAPGTVTLTATRAGYLGNGSGDRDPAAPPLFVDLASDQHVADLTLSLWKLGAISGTVAADGEPLVGIEIRALRRTLVAGAWRLLAVVTTTTDDRGAYRLSGLLPGEYIVAARPDRDPDTALLLSLLAATPASSADVMAAATASSLGVPERDSRLRTYGLTFYRDAQTSGLATRVPIDAGADKTGVDFHLRAVRGVRVSGTLTGLDGPAEGLVVRLLPADSALESDPVEFAAAACDGNGRFELANIPSGKYVVTLLSRPAAPAAAPPSSAPSPLSAEPTWWARTAVTVGTADISGITVPVHRGVVVGGRAQFNGATAPSAADIAQIALRLDPAEGPVPPGTPPWRGVISPDGRFTTMSAPPGQYFVRVANLPRGWTLESARVGARDAIDEALDIQSADVEDVVLTFSDHPLGGVNGRVLDAGGAPAPGAIVLIFPAERRAGLDTSPQARRFRLARAAGSGTFGAGGLPAGSYLAVAVPSLAASEWQDPARLDAIAPRATRIDIAAGPAQSVTLTLATIAVKK
jgi:hypothetical protein